VLRRAPNNERGRVCWYCVCECGNERKIPGDYLISGHTKSCGCWKSQGLKHGHTKTGWESPEYRAWHDMKQRCLNPNHLRYEDWGGRGIKIYQPWIGSFEAFFAYIGSRPGPEYSFDRIDNEGNYEPANVHWALPHVQMGNTRITHHIPLPDSRVVSMTQLSRELGLPDGKLLHVIGHAKKHIARGTATNVEQSTKVAIQVTFWMIVADMLRGRPDPPQAARILARLVRGKDKGGRR
jgi:hypothetical protein